MSTTLSTTYNDMKTSLRLASKSMLSYFLANLGMVIVVGILAVIIAVPIAAIAWFALAPLSESSWLALAAWAQSNPVAIGGLALLVLIPIVSLFLVVEGSIYGMSNDLVATGETKAEAAFSYLRHKFLTFAGTGAMLTIFIVVPPVTVWGLTSYAMGYSISASASLVLTVFTFIWLFFTCGLTSMVWPAVVSGKGVQEAFKESFNLSTKYFERVFGVLTAILLLIAATFGPVVVWGISQAPFIETTVFAFTPLLGAIALWTVVSVFLWIFLFFPMTKIAYVKVYKELTGGEIATLNTVNDVPIV
jgi:hypothetical protein